MNVESVVDSIDTTEKSINESNILRNLPPTLPRPSSEQMAAILDYAQGNNVVVCSVAGGGKSTGFYGAAVAHRLAVGDRARLMLLCYNKALQIKTTQDLVDYGLDSFTDAFTVHGLATQMFGFTISCDMILEQALDNRELVPTLPAVYTGLMIDETQDMSEYMLRTINVALRIMYESSAANPTNPTDIEPPAKRQRTSVHVPIMCVGDKRQELYAHANDTTGLACLDRPETQFADNGLAWVQHVYSVSFRLTPALCQFVNQHFAGSQDGPTADILPGNFRNQSVQPVYIEGDIDEEAVNALTDALASYQPSDIMILSPSVETRFYSACKRMINAVSRRPNAPAFYITDHMRGLSEEQEYKDKILVTTYFQSKGSERKCVIVLHADTSSIWDSDKTRSYCRNPMHVAVTRSREKLYVIRHTASAPYPTLQRATLNMDADVRIGKMLPLREPADPVRVATQRSSRDAAWLTKHIGVKLVNKILKLFQVGRPVTLGPSVSETPRSSVAVRRRMATGDTMNTTDTTDTAAAVTATATATDTEYITVHENVARYFPEAVMAAAEHQQLQFKNKRPRRTSLETSIMQMRDLSLVRAHYRDDVKRMLEPGAGPRGPRDWLLLSMVSDAVRTGVYCRLHQIHTMDWVREREILYFDACMRNICHAVTASGRETGEFSVHDSANYETTYNFRGVIDYVEPVDNGFMSVPWIFTSADEPSQDELMRLIVFMWMRNAREGRVFMVGANRLVTLADPDDRLLDAVQMLVEQKTSGGEKI